MPGNMKSKDPIEAARAVASSLEYHAGDFRRRAMMAEVSGDPKRRQELLDFLRDELDDWVEFLSSA